MFRFNLGDQMGDQSRAARGVRRPLKALNARFVETVSTPGKHFDGHGLYLRVQPNGSKQWVQRIAIRGKRTEIGLGSPPAVPLAKARELALVNRGKAMLGGDPLAEKRLAAGVMTFEEAARKVHRLHLPTWRNAKHADDFLNSLTRYAFPRLGARKVSELDTADVLAVLTPIWLDKPETARRVRQRIGTVMKWAIAQGWRQDNPAENIVKALPRHDGKVKAHRKALPYDQVAGCLAAVRASRAWPATKGALEFLVLTAARSGEVRMATWSEIALDGPGGPVWEVPAARMKTKRPHRVPLSDRAVAVLHAAETLRDASGLIFPSPRGRPLSDMTLSKLVKELGFDADVHGFRTSFRTWAQECTDVPREVAEAALAHAAGDAVERAYARSDLFEKRRAMMRDWAAFIARTGVAPVAMSAA